MNNSAMKDGSSKIKALLASIDVEINGNRPWDIQVHNPDFFSRILHEQSVGAGESYMEGWWDCEQLDELFYRICRHHLANKFYNPLKLKYITLINKVVNQQTPKKSKEVANRHYNLDNHLFELMLGKSMAYTCGYWKEANTLDEAQFAKYELVCKKLYLKPGDSVLELGCGWGGLAKYMAEKYSCFVVGCDIGKGPANFAKQHCQGLPVSIHHCDYRRIDIYNPKRIKFDKIVSVGVLEHIGYKNYPTLLNLCKSQLAPEGILLLHSIGANFTKNYCDPWIDKYIFPNGMLPSIQNIGEAFENRFVVEDFHNFGAFYEFTLKAWHENFNRHWDELKEHHTNKFRRMMNYYLLSCAAGFRAREMQLWQFVLTQNGMEHGYQTFR